MSLKYFFAKVTNALGYHPPSLFNEQLRAAIESDDGQATERIIYCNPDIAKSIRTMFEHAVKNDKFNPAIVMAGMVPDVLKKDYSAGEDLVNRSILMQRTISGSSKQVSFLIGQGADVKAADDSGDTALHFAAAHGRIDSIEPLARAGANVNAANKEGVTPLMLATVGYTADTARNLLAHGADIATRDAKGLNATMHALHNQNIKAAQMLMEQGGKVLDHADAAIERIRRVAESEAEWDFLRLLNSQYDINRNRQEELAKMTMKEICETGTSEPIKVRPIRLKR